MNGGEGRKRVVIEKVQPEVNGGRFPIKRTVGEKVLVEANVFADGHDTVACALLHRRENETVWQEELMQPLGNDRWRAQFTVTELGRYFYSIEGWMDPFQTWRKDLLKRLQAEQDVRVDLLVGAELIEAAAGRASGADAKRLSDWEKALRKEGNRNPAPHQKVALDEELAALAARYPDRCCATRYQELPVTVDRVRARFGSWYEVFPRSCAPEPGRHGTFRDLEGRLESIAAMGFDVLYLPPIHPIGRQFRKGKNNVTDPSSDDVGSPWAIGSGEGGYKSIHPDLGTLENFRNLVRRAKQHGLEIALDIAYQCSPDHPYVKDHPEWFRHRPDGTIQYAENPPKKYQDIYPLDFETEQWSELWQEMKSVVLFWMDQGVRIFRVDNPHTKPFGFWEWLIREVRDQDPEVIFLAEAFTRPKVMYRLAKAGFTQSYTYFTWRNTKSELTEYFTELTQSEVREFFRPNLWPNTPDILPEYLQHGGRPAFITRLALAGTLGANYGLYGPAFELCENQPKEPGSEEYLNSEKYEIKHRDLNASGSLKELIGRLNRARRDNPALQSDWSLRFHSVDNDMLLCYSKSTDDLSNVILAVVSLDFNYTQSGWVQLDLAALGLEPDHPFQVHDLLGDGRYLWQGPRNYVELNPHILPAHLFRIRR
ncbi:MAG: alpha-1,4-glucan--maltose-1-phosphate maltosyltransferase [Acidobacteria bacterium RIFCSPLOWO2_02_FULL_59_13]|nr:MAG: alpha-1,4-glucan--maltose-1-phosphate maltosyltransferase [Acidobacteria bacterium RIFCSPLOWO2_02_FULL_59_13]